MKKYIITTVLAVLLVGCAGTSMSPEAKQTLANNKGYTVGAVTVAFKKISFLDFSKEQKLYPNEQTLAKYFKEDMNKYLKQTGKACTSKQTCLTIDMNVDYTRNFNFQSVTVSKPIVDMTYSIKKEEKVIYTGSKNGKLLSSSIVDRGLNELSVLTNVGNDKPNLKDERKHIDMLSGVVVEDIVTLSKNP
ncbi:MAG: Unknown protein [uncultured Sulfurovum sp.]|uniref:DUF4136 domain-containing protein n=1 Tax=uncultured Sulfurovum sp. TaxID=269237 RepID=A0A6S6U8N9_9BACT|nr:MAG: Unknown protein [uncultured Sulfurovum sp.]